MRLIFFTTLLFSINLYSSNTLDLYPPDSQCKQNSGENWVILDGFSNKMCATQGDVSAAQGCLQRGEEYMIDYVYSGGKQYPRIKCIKSNILAQSCEEGTEIGLSGRCEEITGYGESGGRGGSKTVDGNQQQEGRVPCSPGVWAETISQCPSRQTSGGSETKKKKDEPTTPQKIPCNVANIIIQTNTEDECNSIATAYEVTAKTPGHEDGLGLNVNEVKQQIQTCQQKEQDAQKCCGDPYSCVGGTPGGNQAMSVLGGILQGGNKLIAGGTASITSACETLKNLGRSASAVNAAMSQTCRSYADSCQKSCTTYNKHLTQMNNYYSNERVCDLKRLVSKNDLNKLLNVSTENYVVNCNQKTTVTRLKEEVTAALVSCNTSKQQVAKILQDAVGTQSISEFANKCQDISSNQNEYAQDTTAPFNGDCTNPAHSSNPICVQCRIDPSAQQCAGVNTGNRPSQANNINNGISEDSSDSSDDLMGLSNYGTMGASDDNPGLAQKSALGPNGNQGLASAGGGGGGGGLGQDNIQALGTDPSQDGGGGGGAGYNTDIIGNAKGGGGYSGSSMGFGSGGGYSGRITTDIYDNTPATGIIKDGFDLKEYLPGGKAFKRKSRLPAGYIQLPDGEVIGPKHGNIFQMMHERYAYYESLGKFWPAHFSKEKIECIKKSGIMNNPPYSNQWDGDNLHKVTPVPNPSQCRHFADHDPNKPDPTQIYLKAQAKKEMQSRTPQSVVASYKNKSLHEIYHALTRKKKDFTKEQYSELYKLYNNKYADYKKSQ